MANESSIIQEHSGKIVSGFFMLCGTVLMGMSKWLVGREVDRIDEKFKAHDKGLDDLRDEHGTRLRALEMNFATKDDLHEIRNTMTTQHGQIMDAIMSIRGRE